MKNENYVARDIEAENLNVVASDGSYLITDDGKRYLDLEMGWCVGNIGWTKDDVVKAIKNFTGPTYVLPGYLYNEWEELAKILAEITPGNLSKTFRATGGTEAVEIALQAAMKHTGRNEFISIEDSYHGHSIGAMSVGASYFRDWYTNLLPNCHKIQVPLDEKAAIKVEELLKTKKIAAFICEPIICNLGVEIPTKEFFTRVQKACKETGTLLIADEVATGFGRTGKMFASEHYDLKPDIMTLGKAITGGYAALGATITTPEVAKSMEFDFSHYSTFGWQPLNTVVTLANVKSLLVQKDSLLENVQRTSEYFVSRLEKMNFKSPVKIIAKGLAIAIHISDPNYLNEIIKKAFEHKLLILPLEDHSITIFPNLAIDMKTAEEAMDLLEKSV